MESLSRIYFEHHNEMKITVLFMGKIGRNILLFTKSSSNRKLIAAYDDGLMLEATRENQTYKIFVPYGSIKCAEIFSCKFLKSSVNISNCIFFNVRTERSEFYIRTLKCYSSNVQTSFPIIDQNDPERQFINIEFDILGSSIPNLSIYFRSAIWTGNPMIMRFFLIRFIVRNVIYILKDFLQL
jgi:hypothetical protein